jgi:RimJ/RimL family protein N-acetyltransferase
MRNRIETDRLVLRPFAETDWKSVVTYAGDIDVARATGRLPHPYSYADAKNWIAVTKTADRDHIYGIAKRDNHLIGCISLMAANETWELGYWLGQAFWHQGYMREAAQSLLSEAGRCLAPATISATVFHDNPRSLALLQVFGFHLVEDVSEFCIARGHAVDARRLGLNLAKECSNA